MRSSKHLLTLCVTALSVHLLSAQPAQAQFLLKGTVKTTKTAGTQSVRQANQLLQTGKWDEAEKFLQQAVAKNPNDATARAALAVVQAELLKLGGAEHSAKMALIKDKNNPYAHIALGTVYQNQTLSSNMTYRSQRDALLNKAAEEYKTALKLDPQNPDAYNKLGQVYREQGRWADAEQAFGKALSIDPKFAEAMANQGSVLQAKGQTSQAIGQYQKAITLNSKNFWAHYYLGSARLSQGDLNGAYQSLNTALYLNPRSPYTASLHTRMGEVLERQGNMAAAISHYRQAISRQPEYVEAYQRLADLFDGRGDSEFAMAELKSALNANPNYTPFKLSLGRLALASDKPDQALVYYQEALKQDPSNPVALEGLAQAYSIKAQQAAVQGTFGNIDQLVDAEASIDKALAANPNDLNLHLAKLRIQQAAGKPALDQHELETRLAQPAQTETQQLLQIEALNALGRYPESDTAVQQLLQRYGSNTRKQLQLADVLKTNGDLVMAKTVYQNVLSQDPQNPKALRGMQRVEAVEHDADKSKNLANAFNGTFASDKKRRSAKDFYLESVSLSPRQPDVRLALAKIYSREKAYEQAVFEYQAYLNLSPDLDTKERASIEHKIQDLREAATQ